MIKKIKRKFILVSLLAVSVLLITILGIVNIVNFTLITDDADKVIDRILTEEDRFLGNPGGEPGGGMERQMGPTSPDMAGSMRFFKVTFDKNGNVVEVVYKMSVVTESEAIEWARELLSSRGGWTNLSYRFRTVKNGGNKVVIVVDESRELLPSYRVLVASIVGIVVGILVSFTILVVVSKRFVKPIEESDAKQKKFISDAARELKNPVTIMALENDVIKTSTGESDSTKSIDKQILKLNRLTKKMNELIILNDIDNENETFSLSDKLKELLDNKQDSFKEKGINVFTDVESDVMINACVDIINKMLEEIISNGIKYSSTFFRVNLNK